MANTIQSIPQYSYFNNFQTKKEPITVETLSEDLQEYNNKNNDDIMFIDMLEKISLNLTTEERLSISRDGNKLLEVLDKEISKLNGINSYMGELSNEMDKFEDLNLEISKLKSELLRETDEQKILDLQTQILELETLLLSSFT